MVLVLLTLNLNLPTRSSPTVSPPKTLLNPKVFVSYIPKFEVLTGIVGLGAGGAGGFEPAYADVVTRETATPVVNIVEPIILDSVFFISASSFIFYSLG
ncbi:conserved hypothetical protein [Planktothrix agardhii]|nr:conserved hypothetical protein [Planktothrix agardhii]